MPRDHRLYIEDILDSIGKIKSYIGNATYEEFMDDSMKLDAVVRNLEIIGEASKHIPSEIK